MIDPQKRLVVSVYLMVMRGLITSLCECDIWFCIEMLPGKGLVCCDDSNGRRCREGARMLKESGSKGFGFQSEESCVIYVCRWP